MTKQQMALLAQWPLPVHELLASGATLPELLASGATWRCPKCHTPEYHRLEMESP